MRRTWVLGTSPASGMYPWWNAEGWFARQRREHRRRKEIARRRARYEQGANPDGIVLLADVHPLGGDLESDLPPSAAIKPPGRPVSWVVQWDDAEETVIVLGPGLPFPMLDVQNGESQDVRKALAHEVARRLNSEPLPTGLVHVPGDTESFVHIETAGHVVGFQIPKPAGDVRAAFGPWSTS